MLILEHIFSTFDIHILCRIKELSTRYRENLQLVLKDVTVNVEHGEKVM
jgi:ABC-type transport system involved in cytochrome bd biosynthesis fused ATPase/permease subunit